MITRRTRIQLLIFAIITVVGVSYVGARYARLDRLFVDDRYTVVAHFADSGGIFEKAEVTYRGVKIGQVEELVLTDSGVDVLLGVDNDFGDIPADATALVGNRSAVGEQYVELQPQSDEKPYLVEGSEIAQDDTATPLPTQTLLTNLSETVRSVDKDALRTTVFEMGQAFDGTGEDLQQIIDTGNSFLETADANFDVTKALIRDSNTVLNTQLDSGSAIRDFSRDLKLFSDSLAGSDQDLRTVIDTGSGTATQLRTFLEQNRVDLGELIRDLTTTGEVVVRNLDGVEQLLVTYPYVVEGGFTVVSKSPETGLYDAHFGFILQQDSPVCNRGYEGTNQRTPQEGADIPMNVNARCTEPAAVSNARGSQNEPSRAGVDYSPPVVASFDPDKGKLTWGDRSDSALTSPSSTAPKTLGDESWKWLFLQPLTGSQE